MSNKEILKRITYDDITSLEGLRLWIGRALEHHYKDKKVPNSDVAILFPKIKELIKKELWEEKDNEVLKKWIEELAILEERVAKVSSKI